MVIRIYIILGMILLLAGARSATGQCYVNPTGESAVGMMNSSSYFLTFYIDGENKGGVPSGDKSIDFVISPGEHSLTAVAIIGGQTSSAGRTATIPAGYVCTWTVTDPPPSSAGASASVAKEDMSIKATAAAVDKPKPSATAAFKDPLHQVETITVSGYIREGVECLVLEPFNGGQKYSVHKDPKLIVGNAYRITGPVFQVSYCMQGFPTLAAMKIRRIEGR